MHAISVEILRRARHTRTCDAHMQARTRLLDLGEGRLERPHPLRVVGWQAGLEHPLEQRAEQWYSYGAKIAHM